MCARWGNRRSAPSALDDCTSRVALSQNMRDDLMSDDAADVRTRRRGSCEPPAPSSQAATVAFLQQNVGDAAVQRLLNQSPDGVKTVQRQDDSETLLEAGLGCIRPDWAAPSRWAHRFIRRTITHRFDQSRFNGQRPGPARPDASRRQGSTRRCPAETMNCASTSPIPSSRRIRLSPKHSWTRSAPNNYVSP
jgi:hypothetical protein